MEVVDINRIPESCEINGTTYRLRDRMFHFLQGSTVPLNGIYLYDILRWIEWEGMPIIKEIIGI